MTASRRCCGLALAAAFLTASCNAPEPNVDRDRIREQARDVAVETADRIADSWLATKIQAQFFADDDIRARDITVTADDGVVTLRGHVTGENAHRQAVQTARNTDGVVRLVDELTVGPLDERPAAPAGAVATSGNILDNVRITSTIQSKFFLDDLVKGRNIDVDTRQGVVTLQGDVASEAERMQAVSLARHTTGVERVDDRLRVDPNAAGPSAAVTGAAGPLDDATVTTRIQAKFFLDREVKGGDLDVSTRDGVVVLEGRVPTPAARERALALAGETEGVVQVIDRMQVLP